MTADRLTIRPTMTRSSRNNRSKVFRASCASSLTRPTINRDKGEQRCVGHVPSRDVHQPSWTTAQQMTVPEVAVLRDDDAILAISDLTDHLIGRRVTVGQVQGVIASHSSDCSRTTRRRGSCASTSNLTQHRAVLAVPRQSTLRIPTRREGRHVPDPRSRSGSPRVIPDDISSSTICTG